MKEYQHINYKIYYLYDLKAMIYYSSAATKDQAYDCFYQYLYARYGMEFRNKLLQIIDCVEV